MRHFWENTLLFVKASDDGHQEYDSNIQVSGNEDWGLALFRIWKNRRDWVLMQHLLGALDGKRVRWRVLR